MKTAWRVILGVVLVLMGALALLQNFGQVRFEGTVWGIVFGLIFGGAGAGFLVSFFQNPKTNWWAVIPGMVLLGLGVMIVLGALNFQPEELLATIFLGSIGASFWLVYFTDRTRWWAIIPGGVMVSVASLVLFESLGESWPVVIFFGGMAATFGLVALLTSPGEKQRTWAWYPAGVMGVLAVIMAFTTGPVPGIAFPILLIGAGLVMVAWTFLSKRSIS
jgi:uncharacterized membrane protein HdeD (DUF308 family)